jgi:hypothetical protein
MRLSVRYLLPVGGALLGLSLQAGPGAASQLTPHARRAASPSTGAAGLVITGFKVSHARFRVGASTTARVASGGRAAAAAPAGTTFTLHVNERATLVIEFAGSVDGHRSGNRCIPGGGNGPGCTTVVRPGFLIRSERGPGTVSIHFSGRVGNTPLAPGQYVAGVAGIDRAENISNVEFARFIVVPG